MFNKRPWSAIPVIELLDNSWLIGVKSDYFVITDSRRYGDFYAYYEKLREVVVEVFPNVTGEENVLNIFLFAGNTAGSIWITQSVE